MKDEKQEEFKAENLNENYKKEVEMAKKNKKWLLFLQILRWFGKQAANIVRPHESRHQRK